MLNNFQETPHTAVVSWRGDFGLALDSAMAEYPASGFNICLGRFQCCCDLINHFYFYIFLFEWECTPVLLPSFLEVYNLVLVIKEIIILEISSAVQKIF